MVLLLGVLVHGVLPIVIVPELLGISQNAEEYPAHPTGSQVICSNARRGLGFDLQMGKKKKGF